MTAWHIARQYEHGDETVFKCERFAGGEWQFSTVRVLTIWWRTQGSVADIHEKAERNFKEGQKP